MVSTSTRTGGSAHEGVDPREGEAPDRTLDRWQWGAVLVPVAVLVVLGWQQRWMSDDGFIHLRVVEQLTAGHGPVFNVGERVEASTSPLWIAVLGLADLVPGPALPWKAVVIGIAGAGVGLLLAQRADVVLTRAAGDRRLVVPLGAIVVVCLPPFWDFASSGLETGMIFAWLGASQWWCARRVTARAAPRPRRDLAGAALVGVGYLIHPELVLFTLVFGAVLVAAARRDGRRRAAAVLVAMWLLPVAYQVFRMGYYAVLVPNTAIAKDAAGAQWRQGLRYLLDLVLPYGLWLPLAVLVAVVAWRASSDWSAGARLRGACRVAPIVGGVLQALYIVRVGGDFMHARLLLPALFALVAPVGVPLSAADLRPHPARPAAGVAAAVATAAWVVASVVALPRPGTVPHDPDGVIAVERDVWGGVVRLDLVARAWPEPTDGIVRLFAVERLQMVDVPLRDGTPWSAASVPAGGVSWSYGWDIDVYALELGSLAHPIGSHVDQRVADRPGHQKPVPLVWQAAGLAEAGDVRDGEVVLVTAGELRAAEAAMACGQLATYLEGIHAPLTPGRFLRNILDSPANTRLSVPVGAVEAEALLCGAEGR